MSRLVYCEKLKEQLEGLDFPPYPGQLGEKVFSSISKQAWDQWLKHQTMLINEYRLSMLEATAREFLVTEMQKFLFGDGSEHPPGYIAPEK